MEKSQKIDLEVSDIKSGIGEFYTDVSTENVTILATSNSDNSLVPVKLGNRGVENGRMEFLLTPGVSPWVSTLRR